MATKTKSTTSFLPTPKTAVRQSVPVVLGLAIFTFVAPSVIAMVRGQR